LKVKLNSPWRGHRRSETIEVSDNVGKTLIRLATAVLVPQKKKATKKVALKKK